MMPVMSSDPSGMPQDLRQDTAQREQPGRDRAGNEAP